MSAAAYLGGVLQAGLEAAVVGLGLLAATALGGRRISAAVRHAILLVGLLKFAMPPLLPALLRAPIDLALDPAAPSLAGGGGWVVALHALGGAITALGLALGALRLRRASGAVVAADARLRSQVEALARQVGVRPPEVQWVSGLVSPRLEGLLRPRLVLPASAAGLLTPEERAAVIAHELAHERRRDLCIHALAALLAWFWWFHPVFWLLLRALRRSEEQACDDLAVASEATSTVALSRALVRLGETLGAGATPAFAAAASGDLRERVTRLCGPPLARRTRLGAWRTAGVCALAMLLLPPLAAARASAAAAGRTPAADAPRFDHAGFDHAARHRARHRH